MKHKKIKRRLKLLFACILLVLFFIWQNNTIVTTTIVYSNPKLPKEFDQFRIAQISDLHNKVFGDNQSYLINELGKTNPDIIVLTGDLIDRRRFNLNAALIFVKEAITIAPVYYVSGNHEAWSNQYDLIKKELLQLGVSILDDQYIDLIKGEGSIRLLGLSDPDFLTSRYSEGTNTTKVHQSLQRNADPNRFQLLLSHRPELIQIYSQYNMDLVLSGHAHGGQIRIPFIGAIIAPDQGLLPKYTSGAYKVNETTLVVSRGLGNSVLPIRLFNRPEIIVVKLIK